MRPPERLWNDRLKGQLDKVATSLVHLEAVAAGFGNRVDIGTITYVCAL